MSRVRGIVLDEAEVREIPKHGLALDEVIFSYGGSHQLVKQLRAIGALVHCGTTGRTFLFDAGDVARTWNDWKSGKYEQQLAALDRRSA